MLMDPETAEIGARIRDRRLALGMSLKELSLRCGVTPNYLGTIERGQPDVGLRTMRKIADGLGTTIAELLGGQPTISPAGLELARLLERAAPDFQAAIVSLLRALRKT
jgi:transcriptional regulator with XRE-family HTH domain